MKRLTTAIAALSKQGGEYLVVPEGIFLTGPIVLKDCIDIMQCQFQTFDE
jgi:polygalacturonase